MIRVYEPGDLSSGFVGIRVAVSVNSKLKQKYWSRNFISTEFAMEHAIEHEQKLLKKQAEYANNRVFSRGNNTGIVGLQLTIDINKKKYGTYTYGRLLYMHTSKKKGLVVKSLNIKDYNISDDDWFDMCLFIKNTRTCTNDKFEKMLAMKPTEEKIKKELSNLIQTWDI